ncbi:MAG: hypothetical protein VCD00_08335, partial [Candidatus Hydrogenedentota bacterium]
MTFGTLFRSRTFTGAVLALGMVAGLALLPNTAFGATTGLISLTQPPEVNRATPGGVLPASILIPVAATFSLVQDPVPATPGLFNGGVTFEVTGGTEINDGTDTGSNYYIGTLDLIDAPEADAAGFTATI